MRTFKMMMLMFVVCSIAFVGCKKEEKVAENDAVKVEAEAGMTVDAVTEADKAVEKKEEAPAVDTPVAAPVAEVPAAEAPVVEAPKAEEAPAAP